MPIRKGTGMPSHSALPMSAPRTWGAGLADRRLISRDAPSAAPNGNESHDQRGELAKATSRPLMAASWRRRRPTRAPTITADELVADIAHDDQADDRGEGHDRADREVEAAGDDHDGRRRRQDQEDRGVGGDRLALKLVTNVPDGDRHPKKTIRTPRTRGIQKMLASRHHGKGLRPQTSSSSPTIAPTHQRVSTSLRDGRTQRPRRITETVSAIRRTSGTSWLISSTASPAASPSSSRGPSPAAAPPRGRRRLVEEADRRSPTSPPAPRRCPAAGRRRTR